MEFIAHLRSAERVRQFWMTFSRPNAFDVESDFHRPMQKLLAEAAGEKGKTVLDGSDLNCDTLEPLARSAASTGAEAAAKIVPRNSTCAVTKRLRGNPVNVTVLYESTDEEIPWLQKVIAKVRETYARIRNSIDHG
ncbi:MAG: hypothetical protein HY763_00355 [Planctomycetes bacterium]|nr:hypothetical protein [Planctomycetota bacterium]